MIDTIALTIPKEKATMLDLSYHGVPSWDLQGRTNAYDKFVKNPSSKDLKGDMYFPRLTAYTRKGRDNQKHTLIKIEFSAPKLLYQNNLDELSDKQFSDVVYALNDRLDRMGVHIERKILAEADVSSVHYSKNFELKNGYTAQYVISELNKINLNKRLDLGRARFINDGQSLIAHATTHEIVFYDKIADLNKGSKRSMDRDQTPYQASLFEKLNDRREILRFEVRLTKKQKMNSVFKELGLNESPTFIEVFSSEKSKKVLWHYWNKLVEKNSLMLFAHSLTAKDLLKQILIARRSVKGKTAIYLVGLLLLAREGNGLRELRSILSKRNKDRTWYRICADATETTEQLNKVRVREWFDGIKNDLQTYKPFHIDDS